MVLSHMEPLTQHHEPEPAPNACRAYGIFADYDSKTPQPPIILLSTGKLAQQVKEYMKGLKEYENTQRWYVNQQLAFRRYVCCSLEQAIRTLKY